METFRLGLSRAAGLAVLMSLALLSQCSVPSARAQDTAPQVDASKDQDNHNEIGRIASARVTVSDASGRPVRGAAVTFVLPDNGVFQQDGSRTFHVDTDGNGLAAAPAICPIGPGPFPIRATATLNGESTPATILQTNETRPLGRLNIRVLRGDQSRNFTKSRRATEQPRVLVTGADGTLVAFALVRFQLPPTGASGTFRDNLLTIETRTAADGTAEASGLQPNNQPGRLVIAVSAALSGADSASRDIVESNVGPYAIEPLGEATESSLGRVAVAMVRVTDSESGGPIQGATVTFEPPPTVAFLDKSSKAEVKTGPNGQAESPPICPAAAGEFPIAVTAKIGEEPTTGTVMKIIQAPRFAKLSFEVSKGMNAVHNIKKPDVSEQVVQVLDENKVAVVCANVTFQAPEAGASGTFRGNKPSFTTMTDDKGKATAPDFRPNTKKGSYVITTTADLTAGPGMNSPKGKTTIPQKNIVPGVPTWLYVVGALAVAAAATCGAGICTAPKTCEELGTCPVSIGATGIPTLGAPH